MTPKIITPRDLAWRQAVLEADATVRRTAELYPWTRRLFLVVPTVVQQVANYVQTTLASGCTNVAGTISVVSAAGLPTSGNFMVLVKDAPPATTYEWMECTAVAGTTLTVTRGQEGTSGIAHSAGAFVSNDVTSAMLLRAFPWGWLGEGHATADQTGITTITDLTNVTVTVTVGSGRKIRITAYVLAQQNTSTGVQILSIREGGTVLATSRGQFAVATGTNQLTALAVSGTPNFAAPSGGSHTYKASLSTSAGTVDSKAATEPAMIVVEDIGAV